MSATGRFFFISIIAGIWIALGFAHNTLSNLQAEILILISSYFVALGLFAGKLNFNTIRASVVEDWFWAKGFFFVILIVIALVICSYVDYSGQIWACFIVGIFVSITIYSIIKELVDFGKIKIPVRVKIPKSMEQVVSEGEVIDSDAKRNAKLYSWKNDSNWKVLQYYDKNTGQLYSEFCSPQTFSVNEAFKMKWQGQNFHEEL